MVTKIVVAIVNIYMAADEKLKQSRNKPLEWKRYIDDIFSLWDINRQEINQFVEQANHFHPTIKFTAETSEKETRSFTMAQEFTINRSLMFVSAVDLATVASCKCDSEGITLTGNRL